MPRYQGELDGLCGLYAVANAFEFCFGKDTSRSFRVCCDSLSRNRWPSVLWEGTTFGDVKRMIAACRQHHRLKRRMTIRVPFWQTRPRSNDEYWEKFKALMSHQEAECALIGIVRPISHWILATNHKSGILFLDSTAGETLRLIKREDLHAGRRKPGSALWLIEPRELIIFEKRE